MPRVKTKPPSPPSNASPLAAVAAKTVDVLTLAEAAAYLRAEEKKRLREIRDIVITSVNNVPVRVGDVVEGGPLPHQQAASSLYPRQLPVIGGMIAGKLASWTCVLNVATSVSMISWSWPVSVATRAERSSKRSPA